MDAYAFVGDNGGVEATVMPVRGVAQASKRARGGQGGGRGGGGGDLLRCS